MPRRRLRTAAQALACGVLSVALVAACSQGTASGSSSSSRTRRIAAGSAPVSQAPVPAGLEGDAQPDSEPDVLAGARSGALAAPAFVGASRAGLHASALPGGVAGETPADETETQLENRQTGAAGWLIDAQPDGVRIEGFATVLSVLAGQPVDLYVSSTAKTFTVKVLRTGDYDGRWARLVWTSKPIKGKVRKGIRRDPVTRMVSADWPRSTTLDTTGYLPGAYLAKLVGADGAQSFVPFVVRDRTSRGAVLLVESMATWQAYNPWGGPSTYRGYQDSDKAADFELRSLAASFDRPYQRGYGTGTFLTNELPAIAAAERLGLRLNYAADLDLQLHPEVLDGAVAVVLLGHSEYWSRQMRAAVTRARDRGVNLAFLGANAVHRRIRLADSPLGEGRVMVNYKLGEADPVKTEDTTADWGKPPFAQPQSSLIGPMFECAHTGGDLVISDPRAWPFAGLGLAKGARLSGVIGPEIDRVNTVVDTPRPIQVLAHSPVSCRGRSDASDVTWYSAASGAGVFNAGTLHWVESMTSTDGTVARIMTGATERVLAQIAQPRAGARTAARDNVAEFYGPDGALVSAAPVTPGPSIDDDELDPEAAGTSTPARIALPGSTVGP